MKMSESYTASLFSIAQPMSLRRPRATPVRFVGLNRDECGATLLALAACVLALIVVVAFGPTVRTMEGGWADYVLRSIEWMRRAFAQTQA